MHRGWLLATVTLLVLGLAPQATAQPQDQPEATVEVGPFEDPLPPTETTEIPVTATVSCEGWGEGGQRTLALFSLKDPPSPYEVSFEPAEIEVPAGPADCQPGQSLDVSTTLEMRPTRQADAGNHFSLPVVLMLEERADEATINEYGPYNEQISFHTGFIPDVEVELVDEDVEIAWRESAKTQVRIQNHANGPARVALTIREAPEDLRVELRPDKVDVGRGEQAEVTVRITDRSSSPSGASEGTITLDTRAFDPQLSPQSTDTLTLQASTAPVDESTPLLHLVGLGLGLAVAGVVGYRHTSGRLASFDPEADRQPKSSIETAAASWLVALGIPTTVWGTSGRSGLLVLGVLALAGGLALATFASLPPLVRRQFAERDPDRLGTGLIGLGAILLFAIGVLLAPGGSFSGVLTVVAFLSLLGGAWALARRIPSPWPGRAVLAAVVVFGFVPMLVGSKTIVVGAFGSSLFAIPVALAANFVAVLGRGLPILAALAVLSVRTRRWGRAVAWMGMALVLALTFAPRSVLDPLGILAGPGAGDELVIVLLAAALLAGVAWLARANRWPEREGSQT